MFCIKCISILMNLIGLITFIQQVFLFTPLYWSGHNNCHKRQNDASSLGKTLFSLRSKSPFCSLSLLFHDVFCSTICWYYAPHVVLLLNASKPGSCNTGFKSRFEPEAAMEGKYFVSSKVAGNSMGDSSGAPEEQLGNISPAYPQTLQ